MRNKANGVQDVEICLSMDSASANMKMVELLSIYLKNLGSAIGMRIGLFVSRCGLHRGSRICVKQFEKQDLQNIFYGISNALRMRKTNKQIHDAFSNLNPEGIDICRLPPVICDRDKLLVKTLRDMLSMKWCRSARRGENLSEMLLSDVNLDEEWDHVLDLTLEGVHPPWVDMPQGKLVRHRCVGLCKFGTSEHERVYCTTEAGTKTLLCDAFKQCFTRRSIGRFQTGRWTKTLPFLKKVGGAMLISPLFSNAILQVHVAADEDKTKELAVRLGKVKEKAKHQQFKFRLAVCLAITHYSDQIMQQHFSESASKHNESDGRRVQHADDEGGDSRQHKYRTGTWRIQHRVYTALADIWKAFKDKGLGASPLDVAMKFFGGDNFADRDSAILAEVMSFNADVAIRFLREFRQFPESLAEYETEGNNVWADQADAILNTPDCDLKGNVFEWKQGLRDTAQERHGKWLRRRYLFWDATCTHCTRQEEDEHRRQKVIAGGHDARPTSFPCQSMQIANAALASEFRRLGGRSLSSPLPAIGRLFNTPTRTIHRRIAFCCVVLSLWLACVCKVAQGMRACFFWHDCLVSCRMCVACSYVQCLGHRRSAIPCYFTSRAA